MNLPAIIIVSVLFALALGLMIYLVIGVTRALKRMRRRKGFWNE